MCVCVVIFTYIHINRDDSVCVCDDNVCIYNNLCACALTCVYVCINSDNFQVDFFMCKNRLSKLVHVYVCDNNVCVLMCVFVQ